MASETELVDQGAVSTPTRVWTLAVVCVATFMLMLDVTVVNVGLPSIRASLGADFSALQWVIDSYTLTLAAFLLTGGSLADRLGRRRTFAVGLVLFTVSSLAAGAAGDMITLNVARGVQGVGAALLFAVGPALIGQEYLGADRGKAFGVFGAVAGLALAFGPLVGGGITDALNWRWIFLINVPIGLLALAATLLRLRESRDPQPYPLDWVGLVVFGAGLALLVLSFLRAEAQGWTSARTLSMFVGGVVLLVAFVWWERRRAGGMLDLSLFRIPTFTGICLATLLSNATSLAAIFLQVSYMQNVLGYSPLATGLRFLPLTLTLFVVAAVTGTLVNSVAPGLLVGLSIALIAVGLGLVTLVDPGDSWTALLPSMVVTGVGMGIFNPPRATVTIGVAEPAKAGMASGMGETFQQVGVAVGIAAFGALFQRRVADSFTASEVGGRLGDQATDIGRSVAADAGAGLQGTVPGDLLQQATAAARTAFVEGMTSVILICGVVAAVGAALAFALIKRSDLHESALGPAPGAQV